MRIIHSSECNYCPDENDILHFFVLCPNVKRFWIELFEWLNIHIQIGLEFLTFSTREEILFGINVDDNMFKMLNYCILQAKYYIHYVRMFQGGRG